MSVGRTLVAVSLDHDRLCAVSASVGGERVRIKAWHSAQMPEGVDPKDAAAVGRWLGESLAKAGLAKGPLVFAVPRGEVVLKKLKLPSVEGGSEADLAGMVRLQMARQLTMAIDGTAIDYVPMTGEARAGEGGPAAEPTMTTVLAGALPGDRMEWYRQAAKAAGMKIARVGLKAAGVSAHLAGVSQRHGGPVLGIALGWGSIEFVVVEDGHLVFARSADIGMTTPGEEKAFTSRVAVEAKRTWMSYRVGQESAIVEGVAVIGEGELARQIGEAAGGALEMPWEPVPAPPAVEIPEDMPEAERLLAAPLIGLLAENIVGRPTLDFANPRRAPDYAAARRRKAMLAALLAILVGGGLYVYGQQELGKLRSRVSVARENVKELEAEYIKHVLAQGRLDHLERWRDGRVDWLAHAKWLSEQLPDPRDGLLDSVRGNLSTAVAYTGTSGTYADDKWSAKQAAVFALDGQVKNRGTANDLRGRLVSSGLFHVDSRGPDVPNRFSFQLTTGASEPGSDEPPPPLPSGGPGAVQTESGEGVAR